MNKPKISMNKYRDLKAVCLDVLLVCVSVHSVYVVSVGRKGVRPWELELQAGVSWQVGAVTWTWGLWRTQCPCLRPASQPYHPQLFLKGERANTVLHYHRLCRRVSPHLGEGRGRHIWSAMDKPCPGKNTFVIMASPLPAKHTTTLTEVEKPEDSDPPPVLKLQRI